MNFDATAEHQRPPETKLFAARIFTRMAILQTFFTTSTIIITFFVGKHFFAEYLKQDTIAQITRSLLITKGLLTTHRISPITWCLSLPTDEQDRVTIFDWEGNVLCDSSVEAKQMSNYLDAPEIKLVKEVGAGEIIRRSRVFPMEMFYSATIIPQKNQPPMILRKSVPINQLNHILNLLNKSIFFFLLPMILVITLGILWASFKFAFPMQQLLRKVEKIKRINLPYYDNEWTLIGSALDEARQDIETFLDELYLENKKFSILVESINEAILAVGKSGEILFANERFKKFFFTPHLQRQEISKINIWSTLKNREVKAYFDKALQENTNQKYLNLEIPTNSGRSLSYFELSISLLHDTKGRVLGAVGVFHDETQRRLNEQMRVDFVANVSHEVRTPLTALKGYAQILKERYSQEDTKELVAKIESNSDRLTNMFTDILNLSVIESNPKITKEHVFLEDIVSAVNTNVKQAFLQKKIKVEKHFDLDCIYADPALLEQVLTNLIENAYKYSPQEGVIQIRNSRINRYSLLEIFNSGEQISTEHQERIFERFYRVDTSRSRAIGGTGLGLSIVKHIVNNHGGKVWVENGNHGGVSFFATFPLPS